MAHSIVTPAQLSPAELVIFAQAIQRLGINGVAKRLGISRSAVMSAGVGRARAGSVTLIRAGLPALAEAA